MEALLKLIALFLTLFFIFLLGLRIFAQYKLKKMLGSKIEGVDIRDGILYFYSDRCSACKLMAPEIETLKDKTKVLAFDVFSEEGSQIAKNLGVMATPTTLIVRDGIILKSFVGVVKAERLIRELSDVK